MKVGKTIWRIRNILGMTQVEFAKKVGITQAFLSRVETGSKPISNETLDSVAKKLGLTGPVLQLMSLEAKDVPENKRDDFMMIKDSAKALAEEIIFESLKNSKNG